MTQSLEWELAQRYWDTYGTTPFTHEIVPYAVNNSGWASHNAAAILFANGREVPTTGPVHVLELGAGSGLFARLLLDAFRDMCNEHGVDDYHRLTYFVTDRSMQSVQQWQDQGLFTDHADHVVVAQCNALEPDTLTTLKGQRRTISKPQAIFANYVLDALPMAIVRRRNGAIEQLCTRTYLPADCDTLRRYTSLTPQQLVDLARSDDPSQRAKLLSVLPALEHEVAYRHDGIDSLAFLRQLLDMDARDGRRSLCYGAIHCIEACLDLLAPTGFVLINDYGPATLEQVHDLAYVQRFGGTVAASVNFPLLEQHVRASGHQITKPPGDDSRSIHARLISLGDIPNTITSFQNRFGDDRYAQTEQLVSQAVKHVNAGRYQDALSCFEQAVGQCPEDWYVLGQAAQFLTQQLQQHRSALALAQQAIRINPWSSSFLWNTLGNSLYCLGQHDQAHESFRQARTISDNDPQTYLNLSFTLADQMNYRLALTAIARGLEHDTDGRFREHLLRKQQEILTSLANHREADRQREIDRHTVFSTAQ